ATPGYRRCRCRRRGRTLPQRRRRSTRNTRERIDYPLTIPLPYRSAYCFVRVIVPICELSLKARTGPVITFPDTVPVYVLTVAVPLRILKVTDVPLDVVLTVCS